MAKSSILDITIKLLKQGDGDKATIKALAQLKQGWGQAMGVMAAVAGVGYTLNQVYTQTGQVFMDYAANVLQTARATGLSAQESSRLIQVTDDLGVSYETLAKAIKSSADTTDFSIEGLAQASAAYLALTDTQARAKFAQDQYGKSWVDMVAVLEKGPEAIRAMSSSVNQNLILTERSISDYEKWRIELDDFGDSVEGLKVQIGGELVSGLNDAITSLREFGGAMQEAEAQTGRTDLRSRIYIGNLVNEKLENQRAAQAIGDHADRLGDMPAALEATTTALEENAAALEATSKYYENLLDITGQVQSADEAYKATVREQFQLQADLNAQLAQGKITQEEYNQKIAEAGATVQQAAAEHEAAANRIIFSIIQMRMAADGLSDAEGAALLDIGVQMGIFSKSSVETAKGYMSQADEIVASANTMGTGVAQGTAPATQSLIEAKEQAHGLKEQLDGIEKKSGSVWVFTIIINTIGSVPNLPGENTGSRGTASGYIPHEGTTERAEGGPLGAGWTWVGEAGRELISPTGYVFDHATSMKLAESGLVPDRGLRIGGSLSGDEADYYSTRPRGDTGEWSGSTSTSTARRSRRTRTRSVSMPRGARGGAGGDESAAISSVDPLVTETQQNTNAMQSASQAQVAATAAQTSAIVQGNSEVVTAINGMRSDIRKMTTTIPSAMKEAVMQTV